MPDVWYDWEVMAKTLDVVGRCACSFASVDECYGMRFR